MMMTSTATMTPSKIRIVPAAQPVSAEKLQISPKEMITALREALKARTKTRYSITNSRGTAYGWIHIDLMPSVLKTLDETGVKAARKEMHALFGFEREYGDISIPSSYAHRREYLERAEGKTPTEIAEAYWD